VRVFGKEFWYGGGVFADENYAVPERFGKPVRVIELGQTLRSNAELLEFIRHDLLPVYNRSTYHVLHNNCICFANEVVRFLLHGKEIPEEVRKQPKWVESSSLYPVVMPILTNFFSFVDDNSSFHPLVDDMTEEWRKRVQKGDLVLYRQHFIDAPQVVQLQDISNIGGCATATVIFFKPSSAPMCANNAGPLLSHAAGIWEWTLVQKAKVPVSQLYPSSKDVLTDRLALPVNGMDTSVRTVLRRTTSKPSVPICVQGHPLATLPLSWMSSPPICSVCHTSRAGKTERRCCQKCSFDVCGECFEVGCNMKGGGVFSDILTPPLASELLRNADWLSWKSRRYFSMADVGCRGILDECNMWRTISRLKAELGLGSTDFDKDLEEFLGNQHRQQNDFRNTINSNFFETLFHHIISAAANSGALPFESDSSTIIGL
jgi:hypothetical protein